MLRNMARCQNCRTAGTAQSDKFSRVKYNRTDRESKSFFQYSYFTILQSGTVIIHGYSRRCMSVSMPCLGPIPFLRYPLETLCLYGFSDLFLHKKHSPPNERKGVIQCILHMLMLISVLYLHCCPYRVVLHNL